MTSQSPSLESLPVKGMHWEGFPLCGFLESLEAIAMSQISNEECKSHKINTITKMRFIYLQCFTSDKVKDEDPSPGGRQPAFKPHLTAWW